MNPRWPIFIPSKGRWQRPLTARTFDAIGVPYRIVVQPQEASRYRAANLKGEMLLLPPGLDGLVPTRNWIWDRAERMGVERFWTFDDNINGLFRLNRNLKVPVADGSTMRCIEDFADRFENAVICGMNYFMFAPRKAAVPPLYLNTRVYSNMLIVTDARSTGRNGFDKKGKPYRNRGVYNDDTDLCLRVLKDGWCTVLFNAFLIFKMTTMTVEGGNTPIYRQVTEDADGTYGHPGAGKDGRLEMAKELQAAHPDLVTITRKWGRWQHQVNYKPFARNRLIARPGSVVKAGTDEWGMRLVKDGEEQSR